MITREIKIYLITVIIISVVALYVMDSCEATDAKIKEQTEIINNLQDHIEGNCPHPITSKTIEKDAQMRGGD